MPPVDLKNFKRQHHRWNFGNAQILRDRLSTVLSRGWSPRGGLAARAAYLACPGIYLNLYLFPFAFVAAMFQIAAVMGNRIPGDTLCCAVMLGVVGLEVIGEALMFAILGAYEEVPWIDRLRNLIAWWALSLNNARSTWAVLFRRTRPFEVTEKGTQRQSSGASGKSLELVVGSVVFGFAGLPSLTNLNEWSMASMVLVVIGNLVLTTLLLPTNAGKE